MTNHKTLKFGAFALTALGVLLGLSAHAQAQTDTAASPAPAPETQPGASAPASEVPSAAAPAPTSAAEPRAAVTSSAIVATAPSPLPEPAAPAVAPKAEAPSALAVGDGGSLKISSLIQTWAVFQNQENINGVSDYKTTFRVRRAEIKLSGELIPKQFSYGVMIDPAKTLKFGSATALTAPENPGDQPGTAAVATAPKDTSILQDVYLTWHAPWFELSAGQFKTPISYESSQSSGKLLLPERADVVRAYGEQRELGLKLEHKYTHVGYTLGVYNGSGINTLDDNNQKDVALRLEAYPLEGVTLAAVGYRSLGERDKVESTRDRLEGDVALNFGDFVAQGEYIHAWDGATGDGATPRVEGAGWYGAVGYTFAKKLQPVVRLGRLDKNLDVADDTATTLDVGVNYFVSGDRVKLQAAYSHLGNQKAGYKPEQDVILAAQLKF